MRLKTETHTFPENFHGRDGSIPGVKIKKYINNIYIYRQSWIKYLNSHRYIRIVTKNNIQNMY